MTDEQEVVELPSMELARRIVARADPGDTRPEELELLARALLGQAAALTASEASIAALKEQVAQVRNKTIRECAKALDLRTQDILLISGKMTIQELRSVRAMLNERARYLRALEVYP